MTSNAMLMSMSGQSSPQLPLDLCINAAMSCSPSEAATSRPNAFEELVMMGFYVSRSA